MDYQRITAVLLGNATQDAAIKTAKESGNHYADFRLAVRNRQGETSYFPIRCFGKLAEGATAITRTSAPSAAACATSATIGTSESMPVIERRLPPTPSAAITQATAASE